MGSRRQAREIALQALYLGDVCGLSPEESLKSAGVGVSGEPLLFAARIVEGVAAQRAAIDAILARYLENWDLKRLAAIDRNILRLGSFEILSEPKTPVSVIINEAIEIAKLYSTEDSGKFVNGILDKVKNERK